jgi:hypothetical protein
MANSSEFIDQTEVHLAGSERVSLTQGKAHADDSEAGFNPQADPVPVKKRLRSGDLRERRKRYSAFVHAIRDPRSWFSL